MNIATFSLGSRLRTWLLVAGRTPRAGLAGLFRTHPQMADRVRRLRACESEAPAAQAA